MADSETQEPSDDGNIKRLRELADQGKQVPDLQNQLQAVQEQLAQAQRSTAFMKAGFDPEDPKFKYFYNGYDGELTPEAIAAEAETVGLSAQVQSQAPDPAASKIDEAMSGGTIPEAPTAPDEITKQLERLANVKGQVEYQAEFAKLAAMAPPDSALAEELGFAATDAADITNRPRLVPLSQL